MGLNGKNTFTPHGFRHDNSTMLQDSGFPLKEVSGCLGHRNTETTLIYSHRTKKSQQNAVDALNKIAENEFQIKAIKSWSSKYSPLVYDLINEKKDAEDKKVELSICDFRRILGIKDSYPPRYISANILPRITKDLQAMFHNFKIETLKNEKIYVKGYVLTWA